ncbi:MAG: hypothetical protein HUJ95_05670 [Bacteroidales bacterium]|nr:hypothetical protein [Bacteroidales bacterium]
MSTNRIASRGVIMTHNRTKISFDPIYPIPTCALVPSDMENYGTMSASEDFNFVKYLVRSDLKADAVNLLFAENLYSPSDTLSFLKGFAAYSVLQLDTAITWFSKVPELSPIYAPSILYSAASLATLGRTQEAREALKPLRAPSELVELQSLQEAGLCLLENDLEGYKNASSDFTHKELGEYEKSLETIYDAKLKYKKKSPVGAAIMSAIIPGSGKMYAGDFLSGLSSFLIVGTTAGFTAESWIKRGGGDWRTIVLATLTGLFYIGNIYGSYVSVSVIDTAINESHNATILFNIHIPLHDIFN